MLDVTNVVIPIEMTLTTFLERDISTNWPKLSAGSTARCFPARCYDVWQLFVVFYYGPGHMHKYCTLVQANVDPQRLVGDLVANAGRSTRDLNLSHPASYTALTRTTLVPARRALAYFALLISRGSWEIPSWVVFCSLSKWQRFPSNGNQRLIRVFFWLELLIPLWRR